MNNTLEYKGYIGSIEFSESDGLFYGRLMGIRSLITYEGTTAQGLIEDFHGAIDDYLDLCKDTGVEPEKSYKGSFNIRISPELHKRAAVYAASRKVSLNSLVEAAIQAYVAL